LKKAIIGGNWKMNLGTPKESKEIVKELIPLVEKFYNVDIVIIPPYTVLTSLYEILKETNIK
jgi:triosephosphate isomerase